MRFLVTFYAIFALKIALAQLPIDTVIYFDGSKEVGYVLDEPRKKWVPFLRAGGLKPERLITRRVEQIKHSSSWLNLPPPDSNWEFILEDPQSRNADELMIELRRYLRNSFSGGTADRITEESKTVYSFLGRSSDFFLFSASGMPVPFHITFEIVVETKDSRVRIRYRNIKLITAISSRLNPYEAGSLDWVFSANSTLVALRKELTRKNWIQALSESAEDDW